MFKRTSRIDQMNINILGNSSVLQIGDTVEIDASTYTLAIKRDREFFSGGEESFGDYAIFTLPLLLQPVYEQIYYKKQNKQPEIHVPRINITAVSNASVAQIGSNKKIKLDSRIKNIRQILDKENIDRNDNKQDEEQFLS